ISRSSATTCRPSPSSCGRFLRTRRSRPPRTSRARRSATPTRARPARRWRSWFWKPPASSPRTPSWSRPAASARASSRSIPAPSRERLWSQHKDKYRLVVRASDTLPPLDNVVGVTTAKAAATRGDFLRAVLRGRRQAVDFMYANPDEASEIIAKVYNLSPQVTRDAVRNLTSSDQQTGVRYWGVGNFSRKGMDDMIRAQRLVDALKGDVDWSKMVDESFLSDDLKSRN